MPDYPTEAQARADILEAGRRLYARGLAAANDGNISARVSEREIWATPTNVSKGFMTEDMLVKLDIDGNVLAGTLKPSSEIQMHLAIYRRSRDILGVVHAHPPVASAFAAAGIPLDVPLLQESVTMLGVIPVAAYAMPGSRELADGAAAFCPEYNGCLLEHHGAVAWGGGVMPALFRMEGIEHTAAVLMYSRMMGITRPMSDAEVVKLTRGVSFTDNK